jgi:hypothetical protein
LMLINFIVRHLILCVSVHCAIVVRKKNHISG